MRLLRVGRVRGECLQTIYKLVVRGALQCGYTNRRGDDMKDFRELVAAAYRDGEQAYWDRGEGLRGGLDYALMQFDHRHSGMFAPCPLGLLGAFADGWADAQRDDEGR